MPHSPARRLAPRSHTRRLTLAALAALSLLGSLAANESAASTPSPAQPLSGKRQIAFVSSRAGGYEVYTMDEDGANERRLTFSQAFESNPTWSPDGRRIAFERNTETGNAIFIINADGTNETRLAGARSMSNPAWSPDGSRIAFTGVSTNFHPGIFVVNTDGTGLVDLTKNTAGGFDGSYPAWSPDGRRLVFTSGRDDGLLGVYVMDADGSNQRRLVAGHGRWPAWSPDGTKIAYTEGVPSGYAIAVVNADGTNKRTITSTAEPVLDIHPSWSPDGTKIVFVSGRDKTPGAYELYVMNADGSNPVRLTNNTGITEDEPAWQPVAAPPNPEAPALLTEATTGRAVALDSVRFVTEPFPVVSPSNLLAADRRTRVALFAANVAHPVEVTDISVWAEDSAEREFQLPVEYAGRVPGFDWLTQIVVRLPDEAATADYLWLGLNVRGLLSNKAVVRIKKNQ